MKFMLLIHQGTSPTPRSPEEWGRLPEDEQNAVYADYKAINETPGVTPGLQLAEPETASTVRVQDGKSLITDGPFAEQQGPAAGLEIVDGLALEDYRYLHATRGELLRRLGRTAEARDAYERAQALTHDEAERRLLERRLAEL
jgi:hypothetical protein